MMSHDLVTLGSSDDLEYYIRECGIILGVTDRLPEQHQTAKDILEFVMTQIADYKKFDNEPLSHGIAPTPNSVQ